MGESSVIHRRNCLQSIGFARHAKMHDAGLATSQFLAYEIDASHSSPENWHFCKPDCNSDNCDLTKPAANLDKARHQDFYQSLEKKNNAKENTNRFGSENVFSNCVFDSESSSQPEHEARKARLSHKRLGSNSPPEANAISDHAIPGASESEQLKGTPTNTGFGYMTPQKLSTPESANSPDRNFAASPGFRAKISAVSLPTAKAHNHCFSSATDLVPAEVLHRNQTMLNNDNNHQIGMDNCSSNDCADQEPSFEEKNGGNLNRQFSSGDATGIYPWMKDTRQNQKKTQSMSVSSSGKY